MKLDVPNIQILAVNREPQSLLKFDEKQCEEVRAPLLKPLKTSFKAPPHMALYLFKDKSWVVENFNDETVNVELNGKTVEIPGRGWHHEWK